jgi:ubiquinone/menaquinone biosynthesis C-methylase UbiE
MTNFYATIARYYDSEHHDKDEDFEFYASLADEAGHQTDAEAVLIIGAGTGRLALHLAAEGHTVHGIEIEKAMLERARRKLESSKHKGRITLYEGDARSLSLSGRYKMVIIPYNTFMHFPEQDEQIALLRRCRAWTAEGGLLVIDLPNAGESFAAQDTGAVTLERTFTDIDSGHLVMQHSVSALDRAEQIMHVTWIYDEVAGDGALKRTVAPSDIRYFFLAEMRLLLAAADFELEAAFGDFDGTPFEDGVPRMVILAR